MQEDATKYCVDPGHGMSNRTEGVYDPGAVFVGPPRIREADVALGYGLALRDAFAERDRPVYMTREDAEGHAPVGRRAAKAEDAGCDVFISLHLNSFSTSSAHGIEVLYRDEKHKSFADKMQAGLVGVTGFEDRGAKTRTDLAVLKFDGPAILIELGFISNKSDRETLLGEAMKTAVCNKIAGIATDTFP